jgi:hypothetical protein
MARHDDGGENGGSTMSQEGGGRPDAGGESGGSLRAAGRTLGRSGGYQRAKVLPPRRRTQIAIKAANTRWHNE